MLLSCLANCGHYSFKSHVTERYMWSGIGYQFDSDEDSYIPNFQLVAGITAQVKEIVYNWDLKREEMEMVYGTPSFGANVNWDFYSDYNVSLGVRGTSAHVYLDFPAPFVSVSKALNDKHHAGLELHPEGLILNYEYVFEES